MEDSFKGALAHWPKPATQGVRDLTNQTTGLWTERVKMHGNFGTWLIGSTWEKLKRGVLAEWQVWV